MRNILSAVVFGGLLMAAASNALADFSGQTILGPLSNGSIVSGSTLGASDDNDGFDSGIHIFDIWDGGDNVYLLNWLGGDMTVTLDSLGGSDNDLFVYSPGALDSTGDYSIVAEHDEVILLGAAAGDYYINVDSTFFSEGDYDLAITPEPATLGLLGVGLMLGGRRRRRQA
jgi:hypothetical protein